MFRGKYTYPYQWWSGAATPKLAVRGALIPGSVCLYHGATIDCPLGAVCGACGARYMKKGVGSPAAWARSCSDSQAVDALPITLVA